MEDGELESQRQADQEKDEKPETKRSYDEEERKERSTESTIHTVPELLTETVKVPVHWSGEGTALNTVVEPVLLKVCVCVCGV